jgi:hypothetical protein
MIMSHSIQLFATETIIISVIYSKRKKNLNIIQELGRKDRKVKFLINLF